MYTPQNLHTSALITNDRPYAGWLYGGVYLQRRDDGGGSSVPVEENFEVDFGTTGPAALADTIQTWFHRAYVPNDVPNGWHNQLRGSRACCSSTNGSGGYRSTIKPRGTSISSRTWAGISAIL